MKKEYLLNNKYFMVFPVLESERLLYRAYTVGDAGSLQTMRSDPKMMRYMDSDLLSTIDSARIFIESSLDRYRNKGGIFWVIEEKSTGDYIGDFSFWSLIPEHARGEIGYALLPKYWGKGYMTETMRSLLTFGFQKLGLHSIVANINPKNESSRKLLISNGFKKEAYFRENYYFNGKFLDSEIYCLLEQDLHL